MKIRWQILFFALILMAFSAAYGQKLVNSNLNGILSIKKINDYLGKHGKDVGIAPTTVAVGLRKVIYTSTDADGRPVQLSGLLALPQGGAPRGMIVFMHGTIWDRKMSPSRLNATGRASEAMGAASVLATAGYAVAMPDYLGLGDHLAIHPYPLNVVNARSGSDMIEPAREVMRRQKYDVGSQLFITGYSEGGGTAMALVRELEQKNRADMLPQASLVASGPYDLSGATREYLLSEAKGEEMIARAYLLGYSIKYFESRKAIKMNDYFHDTMARTVDGAFKEGRTDTGVLVRLALVGTLTGATKSVEHLLTPRFLNALRNTDTSDPVIDELSKNDVYDWRPKAPLMLFSLASDKIVDPRNTARAYEAMQRRGAGRGVRWYSLEDSKLDHLKAFLPALYVARRFFDGGFEAVPLAR